MLKESLTEMIQVAEYCVNYQKNPKDWGNEGCYGYPAAILLFAIADSIGSYVIGGKTNRDHFNIFNQKDYYNLNLDKKSIDIIYKRYRCLLTHNAVLATNAFLDIGDDSSPVFSIRDNICCIYLKPFLQITKMALEKFLRDVESIVENSKQLEKILKK